jgi:uncharacterized OB-fold protein
VSNVTVGGFFAGVREGKLTALKCGGCGTLAIPPKAFCESCGKRAWQTVPLAGDGTVDSFTVIRVAPRKFAGETPYAIAAVRLTEGVSLLGRIVDVPVDKVAVGMRVRFRPLAGDGRTAIGFGPA